jgi:hypothetical protein
MFPLGSARLEEFSANILFELASIIKTVPNKISVSGHTDIKPYLAKGYSNWELSADRANAARRALVTGGLPTEKVGRVVGLVPSLHVLVDPLRRAVLAVCLKRRRRRADEVKVTDSVPEYDPSVIERFAENLYRKASAFVAGSVVVGAVVGATVGAVPLTPLGDAWPIPSIFGFATLLVGGIFGGVIGYVIGDARSFGYRLQAQIALCQLQIERNTALLARAAAARTTQAQQQHAATPEPRGVEAPAPVAPPVTPPVANTNTA